MRVLTERGATVLGAARSLEKAEKAGAKVNGETLPVVCELSEPESVFAAAESVKAMGEKLDVIVCNAGIMALPKLNQQHGYELQFFTNHIGHFILVTELLDLLADDGRVVMVSSEAHRQAPREGIQFDNLSGEKGYTSWLAYGQSKLANILFAKELARRFEGTDKVANALHPGVINTNLARHLNSIVDVAMSAISPIALKSIPQGAATQTYLAAHPDAAKVSGEYFSHCNPARPTSKARDAELAKKLWEKSEEIVAEFR
jgi:WW domain-containing oxidoreductase